MLYTTLTTIYQGRRRGSKSGGADIFKYMPWAVAHGQLGGSGGMLPQKILEI